jgi:hypothetical protein
VSQSRFTPVKILLQFEEVALAVITALLRFFSYLYHGLLSLALFALGLVLTIAGAGNSVRLDMLPWSGPTAIWVLLLGGLFGFITVVLAVRGTLRPLFFLWALLVPFFLIRGYFLSGYHFTPSEFNRVVYLLIGSVIALIGAFSQLFRQPKRR